MKRIAFIEDAFTGSTLPLAKQFCKDGYIVDIYYLRNSIKEPEGTNCEYNASKDRITAIPDEQLYEIRKYIGSNNINIYFVLHYIILSCTDKYGVLILFSNVIR